IGNGYTPAGQLKKFVIPSGAVRLFLGVLDGTTHENCGSFAVAAQVSGLPAPPVAGQATVYGVSDIALASQVNGMTLDFGADTALLNSPVQMMLNLTPTQTVEFPTVS